MMAINFKTLQKIYNQYISSILANDGLTTECVLNYGVSKRNLCINCIFDVNLKKSANKYKTGGPVPFTNGMICPYCNGIGYYGEVKSDQIYLAVLWDYKKWVSPPTNISNPDGYIQTICHKSNLAKIRQAKDITVVLNKQLSNPVFELYEEPTPAGLGDNEYLFCMWKKIGSSAAPRFDPPPPKCYSDIERMQLICDFIGKCFSAIISKDLNCDFDDKCVSEFTKLELLCSEINKCSSNIPNFILACEDISKCYSDTTNFELLCTEIGKCSSDSSSIGNLCNTINGCIPDSILKIKLPNNTNHINEIEQLNTINNVAKKCNNIKKLALS